MEITQVSTQEQIRQVADLASIIWRDYYTDLIGASQVAYMLEKFQSKEAIERQITEGWLYYLLNYTGKPIGYIGLVFDKASSQMQLSKYYILKDYRGKGLGKECMDFIVDLCRQLGATLLWLTVNKHNKSVQIYEKLGFSNAGSLLTNIGDGFVMDDYKMVMKIKYF